MGFFPRLRGRGAALPVAAARLRWVLLPRALLTSLGRGNLASRVAWRWTRGEAAGILTLHMYNQLLDCFKPIHENSGLCTFRALETLCQLITFKTLRPMLEISNTSTPIWGIMARKGNNCIHQIYKLSRDLMKTTDFIKEQVQEL